MYFSIIIPVCTAQVNLTISTCASYANILVNVIFLLRMVFGVFGSIWVIGFYYTFRISFIFITSLLTTKTFLLIAFLMDFHTMTGQRNIFYYITSYHLT